MAQDGGRRVGREKAQEAQKSDGSGRTTDNGGRMADDGGVTADDGLLTLELRRAGTGLRVTT